MDNVPRTWSKVVFTKTHAFIYAIVLIQKGLGKDFGSE